MDTPALEWDGESQKRRERKGKRARDDGKRRKRRVKEEAEGWGVIGME